MITKADNSNADFFPLHLREYSALVEHIDSLLEGQPPSEKGDRFARFVSRVLPQSKMGASFGTPELRPVKTHDRGIDLIAKGKDGKTILYIQAKKRISSATDIREVLDGFNEFIKTTAQEPGTLQGNLFSDDRVTAHCLLFTLSRITGIVEAYESRPSTTKDFYQTLKSEGRLHFIDGDEILSILQAAFRRFSELPYKLVLNLEAEPSEKGNVLVGIVSSEEIKRLYHDFGEALFFENVRDFLGVDASKQRGRTTPNQEIVKTILEFPEKLLERNNGIAIKASGVERGNTSRQLILNQGGIVNGCQTTMCIIEYAQKPCFVQVKVVNTTADEAWNITKAANYQTAVPDIDLEIARSLRPQLLRRYGFISSIEVEHGKKSALQLLDDLYTARVTYDETRLLYIGLFSRTPNNLIAGNYTELLPELIRIFYDKDVYGGDVFRVLLLLQKTAEAGKDRVKSIFSDEKLFERYYDPNSPVYRCFVSILALCGAVDIDITERIQVGPKRDQRIEGKIEATGEYNRMKDFLAKAEAVLEGNPSLFLDYYVASYNVWMREVGASGDDDNEARQHMYNRTRRMSFSQAYTNLRNDVRTMRAMSKPQ